MSDSQKPAHDEGQADQGDAQASGMSAWNESPPGGAQAPVRQRYRPSESWALRWLGDGGG